MVGVVTVWDGLVPAAGAVLVSRGVASARMPRRAAIGIGVADREGVVVDVVSVDMMKVPVVQIVGVPIVTDGGVSAARPVHMSAMVSVL